MANLELGTKLLKLFLSLAAAPAGPVVPAQPATATNKAKGRDGLGAAAFSLPLTASSPPLTLSAPEDHSFNRPVFLSVARETCL